MKPRLLDLFCGAGGAAKGYTDAGFEVTGCDIVEQPNYPFEFFRADALELLRLDWDEPAWNLGDDFDAIHASPPCQGYSVANNPHGQEYPDLVELTREQLARTGLPYVIENVPGAPLRNPVRLCGLSFGLGVKRHRLFETNFPVMAPPCGDHRGDWVTVFGGCVIERRPKDGPPAGKRHTRSFAEAENAMGIDWMTRQELSEAIPPAYTEHIGGYLLSHLQAESKAAA